MFIPNPLKYKVAKLKNQSLPLSADNVEWVSVAGATIPVMCVEDGFCFESISEASRWCDVSEATIRIAVGKKNLTAGGFHWVKHKK